MESTWNQVMKKESPEVILKAMKASAKKMLQKRSRRTLRDGPGRPDTAREPGLGAPNKGKTQASILDKESQGT